MTVELYKNRLIPVSIVEEAATPKYSRTLIIGRYVIFGSIGLVIGLVLGLTLVMFYSAIDSRIFTPWEVEKECDLQVIGSFPAISANKAQSLSVWDFLLSEFSPTALQVLGRLDLIGWKQGQIMLVTSASIGEGKTTTALQIMAALIRDKETRVLLVDGNFYRPELTRLFGKADQSGIVDVLKGLAEIKEVIRSTEAENLHFISVGRIDNRLELGFFKKSLNRALNEIRSNYDLILIDSSDVLSSTESTVFASESDRVLMVIKAGSTRRALLVNTLSALEHASRRPFGAILNFRRFPIPKMFYGLW
jgi:receptor protein-tyrosine kinase